MIHKDACLSTLDKLWVTLELEKKIDQYYSIIDSESNLSVGVALREWSEIRTGAIPFMTAYPHLSAKIIELEIENKRLNKFLDGGDYTIAKRNEEVNELHCQINDLKKELEQLKKK